MVDVAQNRRRRWFRFTLQGMLVIVALLAIGMAFVGVNVKRAWEQQQIVEKVLATGARVEQTTHGASASTGDRTWFERFLDLNLSARVTQVHFRGATATDSDLELLEGLPDIENLVLDHTSITGDGLAVLARLGKLRSFLSDGSQLTDVAIENLGKAQSLRSLCLWNEANITDEGLKSLGNVPQLANINLQNCPINGIGLVNLPHQYNLSLWRCPITKEGFDAISILSVDNLAFSSPEVPTSEETIKGVESLKKVTTLQLRGAEFSPDTIGRLRAALPHTAIRVN